jgi:hypothetical protein
MGELVVGRPALKLRFFVSAPLDLGSGLALLYRAVPGSGLDPWLIQARRALTPELRDDLDLLHGFSGRLLYYMEEPYRRFDPLRADRDRSGIDELVRFLSDLPATHFCEMATSAIQRVHAEMGVDRLPPAAGDDGGWRAFIEPALTTALIDDVLPLFEEPERLKRRTIRMLRGVWDQVYRADFERNRPMLEQAAELAASASGLGFAPAFVELTGNRLPSSLIAMLADVEAVTFIPLAHLGSFVSYELFGSDLIVYFSGPDYIASRARAGFGGRSPESGTSDGASASPVEAAFASDLAPPTPDLGPEDLLEVFRALGDPNRLRVIDLLAEGELYAQEIVGRLGIAQSAVSRHLRCSSGPGWSGSAPAVA